MTNEQTCILLKQMCARLEAAIREADDLLPDVVGREASKAHHDPEGKCPGLFCNKDAHFTTVEGAPFAFAPFERLLEEWESDAELLASRSGDGVEFQAAENTAR